MSIYPKDRFVKRGVDQLETCIAGAVTTPGNLLNYDDFTAGTNDDVAKCVVINKQDWSLDYGGTISSGDVIFIAPVGKNIICGVSCTAAGSAGKNVEAGGTFGVEGTTAGQSIGKHYGSDQPKTGINWIDLEG